MDLFRAVVFVFGAFFVADAQSLRVPASTSDRGGKGAFSMFLESPAGKAPVALQWDLKVPPALAVTTADVQEGGAAANRQKLLTCALRESNANSGERYTCILAGGVKPIGNGVIAVVHYQTRAANGVPVRVGIDAVLGASKQAASIPIASTEAIVRGPARQPPVVN